MLYRGLPGAHSLVREAGKRYSSAGLYHLLLSLLVQEQAPREAEKQFNYGQTGTAVSALSLANRGGIETGAEVAISTQRCFFGQEGFCSCRHHRYIFEEKKQPKNGQPGPPVGARLQELGPKFTLKLRSLQVRAPDSLSSALCSIVLKRRPGFVQPGLHIAQ